MSSGFTRPAAAVGSVPGAEGGAALLTDAPLACYVSWREESESVRTAYGLWRAGEPRERANAFAVYHAALDREERAALTFRELVERMRGRRA